MIFYKDMESYIAAQRALLDGLSEKNIPEWGVISKVLAPRGVQDDKTKADYLVTHEVEGLELDSEGVLGDRHRLNVRPSSGREMSLYPRGTMIRQHRHLCVVCRFDCEVLSEKLGVEVTPELLGANLVVERADGAPFSISEVPPLTHLLVVPEGTQRSRSHRSRRSFMWSNSEAVGLWVERSPSVMGIRSWSKRSVRFQVTTEGSSAALSIR